MFDPVKDAIENSPVASTQQLPPTPSFKHNILSSPSTAPANPPSPSRRNSVSSANLSMLLNDDSPPSKRQRTASIHHLLSPTDSRPSSSGGLQIETGSSPGRSTMGPPALPHRSSSAPMPIPYDPKRRTTPSSRLKVPITPEEQAELESNCRNSLRNTATNSTTSRPSSSNGQANNGAERKRRRVDDDQGEARPPPNSRDDSYTVAQHYNRRKEVGVRARLDSPIIGLRNFNNWIKSVLIAKFGRRPLHDSNTRGPNPHGRGTTSGKVLDLGCGKGGDLRKWAKASIREYVGLDIADVSISQARNRHQELVPNQRFDAEFHAFDCFSGNIDTVVSPRRLQTPFDVVSMQFCMHYAFESLDKVRIMLENVSQYLRPGGIFLGTIPNSDMLLSRLNSLPGDETTFGNSVYSIRFDSKREQPLYGHRYFFYLKDAVEDVPEYVVRWEEFTALSLEYGLKVIHRSDFHDIFHSERRDSEYGPLLQTMKVVNYRGEMEMSDDQWHAANIYIAFAFEKQ